MGFRPFATLAPFLLAAACNHGNSTPTGELLASGDQPALPVHLSHQQILAGQVALPDVLAHGKRVFAASWNTLDGAGRPGSTGTGAPRAQRSAPENFNRISGPDSNSCGGCHNVPRLGGGGDNVANVFVLGQRFPFVNFDRGAGDNFEDHHLDSVADERNTLGMFGSGFIELLAREMTFELQQERSAAATQAAAQQQNVTTALTAKGVAFGSITLRPDGSADSGALSGVDADLVVRPFHQKGVVVSLREFTNNAMNHHHGMQSQERFGSGVDADGDGKANELTDGDITAVTLFQATLPAPGRVMPGSGTPATAAVARGEQSFAALGCAGCHVPELRLQDPVFSEPNPFNPATNLRRADVPAAVNVDLTQVGPGPHLQREPDGSVRVRAYTDLKRHDMGPGLGNEQIVQAGVPVRWFLTRKLWGMANEPPYMHHGRALTISEAILMHGGEAQAARDAFAQLPGAGQADVVEFLKTLQVLAEDAAANEVTGTPSGIVGDEPALKSHVDQADVDQGRIDVQTLFARGKQIFDASFNTLDGAGRPGTTGTGDPRPPVQAPHNFNRISGPEANSCAGCHNLPRSGGGGDNVGNVFVLAQRLPLVNFDGGPGDGSQVQHLDGVGNERNTLGMFGSGYVELLAREMTRGLQALRDQAVQQAAMTGMPAVQSLVVKGVDFGTLTAAPGGGLDLSRVAGVDQDLVVKPFHQKGVVNSLRVFSVNALNHHHGMQAVERFGHGDADGDGVVDEISVGDVTALTLYQALLPAPAEVLPADGQRQAVTVVGKQLFRQIGCADCHKPDLVLDDPVFTEPDPFNPAGNLRLQDVPHPFAVDLTTFPIGPRLPRGSDGKVHVPAYTDLKRHDLGPECDNERLVQAGVATRLFLTRKLWGFFSEPPFMHHGRALTVGEAIEMHGGEAASARDGFRSLHADQRAAVIDFLRTLQIVPEQR